MALFKPKFIFDKVSDISVDFLTNHNIHAVILDLDGTVCPTRAVQPPELCDNWLCELKNHGIKIFLLSNNRHIERVRNFCRTYEIDCFRNRAKKPFKSGFLYAAKQLGVAPQNIAVIGDQIYTDVLGGNLCGMQTFFVFSMDYSIWYINLRHMLELPFILGKRQQYM